MPEYETIYQQLETAAHRAYTRGIQTGSGGNLSARVNDANKMIVKASGGSFADCSANGSGFVLTDFDGKVLDESENKPTREVYLHGMLYEINPSIGGIMHCHSPWAISWSFTRLPLPLITQHLRLKLGVLIPVVDIDSPMIRPEDRALIQSLFDQDEKPQAFILVGHGVVAVGKDILEAEHNAELVEETAQIAIFNSIMRKLGTIR